MRCKHDIVHVLDCGNCCLFRGIISLSHHGVRFSIGSLISGGIQKVSLFFFSAKCNYLYFEWVLKKKLVEICLNIN